MIKIEETWKGKNGGYVEIYNTSDKNKKEKHIEVAQILADFGDIVQILPEIHYKETLQRKRYFPEFDIDNKCNPDFRLNGILGDFKILDSQVIGASQIKNAIKTTAQKNVSICVISLLDKEYNPQQILSQMQGSLRNTQENKSIEYVILITDIKIPIRISRELTQHKDFYKLISTF